MWLHMASFNPRRSLTAAFCIRSPVTRSGSRPLSLGCDWLPHQRGAAASAAVNRPLPVGLLAGFCAHVEHRVRAHMLDSFGCVCHCGNSDGHVFYLFLAHLI